MLKGSLRERLLFGVFFPTVSEPPQIHYNYKLNGSPYQETKPEATRLKSSTYATISILGLSCYGGISRSSQCSTTGVTKAVVCVILSVGWCI